MAPNPRVLNAFAAMRALGISEEEVKPVLRHLLDIYEGKWELIEEDNYRTLIDAYFELKEEKQADHKRKTPISYHDSERPKQKLHLVDKDNHVSSTDKSRQVLSVEDAEIPQKTFKQKIGKPSQTSMQDMNPTTSSQALQTRSREIEGISSLPCMAARDRKLYPERAASAGHCEDPIDEPSYPFIQKEKMTSDHHQKKIIRLGTEKSKLHPGSVSTSYNGSPDASNGNLKMGLNSNRKGRIPKYTNSPNVVCLPLQAESENKKSSVQFLDDITKGSENVKISLLDETGREEPPKFNYIPGNLIYQNANVNISLARIADEGCCADCKQDCLSSQFPCACSQETGGEFAYSPQGILKEEFLTDCMAMLMQPQNHHYVYCKVCPLERPKNEDKAGPCKGHLVRKFIKECWRKCGCDMQCGNRVVQRGIRRKLQVFLTQEGKGWGLRPLEDLPKGCFVCEYAGEVLTNTELYERTINRNSNDRHTYPVTLDADWGSEVGLADEEALCLDATHNGNVARFINHRCFDANLIDIPVEVETPDRHYYHLALFTNRKVNAFEELTWDYGIDFDDHNHPIKAFQCCCGSDFCRDKKQKGTRLSKRKKHKNTDAHR